MKCSYCFVFMHRAAWEWTLTVHKVCHKEKNISQEEARLKTAALDHNLWRATAKNQDRPGTVETAVFQMCRRVHGGSKAAQVRLHLQEGHCVRWVAQGRGCIYPCSTETTQTLAWHRGVGKPEKDEYVARRFSRFELLLPHEAPWKPQDNHQSIHPYY